MDSSKLQYYIEIQRLEEAGLYLFLDRDNKEFYVGKASVQIYDRVKHHLYESHRDEINTFVNSEKVELYICPIENNFENIKDYDSDLNFKEYCVMMNFI